MENGSRALTLPEIRSYRALTAKHAGTRWAEMTDRVLDDLQQARDELIGLRLQLSDKAGPLEPDSPMTFGQYKGTVIRDVPQDYLDWWYAKQDRSVLLLELDFGPWPKRVWAAKALRLYDYITEKRQTNGALL